MKHPVRAGLLVACGVIVLAVFAAIAFLGAIMGSSPESAPNGCAGNVEAAVTVHGQGSAVDLTSAQLANAGSVIAEGRRLHVPAAGIVIALAVASQESGFTNYANDGRGSDVNVTQMGVEQSLQLPHEAVGSDHGSVGIFQQQWPWWGTMRDLMTPARSAAKFYRALGRVHGWASMPLTVAAQRVQRSAYPDAYADDEHLARDLVGGAGDAAGSFSVSDAAWSGTTSGCDESTATGDIVYPLPRAAASVDRHNWGGNGSHWARFHTGTDLSVACGAPVLAATAGKVVVRTDQSWAGRWLVQVSTGTGQLTTWYAHMRTLTVSDGEQVRAGQQIGEVGDLGNATGCHLHFEVHPQGGSIYRDSVNPSSWLRQHVGHETTQTVPISSSSDPEWFTVATFNVLGSNHTAPGGKEPRMASGPTRMRGVVQLLEKYGVDVVGLQELQTVQHRSLLRRVGSVYATWHARGDTENAIAWRRDRFQLVSARTLSIPYLGGHGRRMPVVQLQDRDTGRVTVFLNVHNPADTRQYPHQAHWRHVAVGKEVRLVRRLSTGRQVPVVVTGDMNDRRAVFCRYTAGGITSSARPAPVGRGCDVPHPAEIDWIFGTSGVQFSDYTREHSRLVRWTTDHPLIVARAHAG